MAQSVLILLICRSTSLKETGRSEKKSLPLSDKKVVWFFRHSDDDGLVPSILCVVLVKWTFNSSGSAAIGLGLGLIIRSSSTKVPLAFSTKVPFDRTYVLAA